MDPGKVQGQTVIEVAVGIHWLGSIRASTFPVVVWQRFSSLRRFARGIDCHGIGSHTDESETEGGCVSAGALAGKADVVAAVRSMHNVLGGTIDPHAAFLLLRGMKTLDVRVQRQNAVRSPLQTLRGA